MLLQLAVGSALIAVKGQAAPEKEAAYTRARELCEPVGDPPELFSALRGLWLMHLLRGELPRAYELAERLLWRAQSAHGPALTMYAQVALEGTSYWIGKLFPAREQLETAMSLYDPERDRPLTFRYGEAHAGITCLSLVAVTLRPLGYPGSQEGQ